MNESQELGFMIIFIGEEKLGNDVQDLAFRDVMIEFWR
jgi:hypothetical protein